jgi:hypothetical protein
MLYPPEERKFHTFLLASEAFHHRRTELSLAGDPNVKDADIVIEFNKAVATLFHRTAPGTLDEAVGEIIRLLGASAGNLRSCKFVSCAGIIEACCEDIRDWHRDGWDYREHLETLHRHARAIAADFYRECAGIVFNPKPIALICQFGGSNAPVASMSYTEVENAIRIGFHFAEPTDYRRLSYHEWHLGCLPMFVHEYLSHIAFPHLSHPIFDDGWMMFAAQWFLRRQSSLHLFSPLTVYQVEEACRHREWAVRDPDVILCSKTAEYFCDLLDFKEMGDQFLNVTHRLCRIAFQTERSAAKKQFQKVFKNLKVALRDAEAMPRILATLRNGPDDLIELLENATVVPHKSEARIRW